MQMLGFQEEVQLREQDWGNFQVSSSWVHNPLTGSLLPSTQTQHDTQIRLDGCMYFPDMRCQVTIMHSACCKQPSYSRPPLPPAPVQRLLCV